MIDSGLYDALCDDTPREFPRLATLLHEPGFFDQDQSQMIRDPADARGPYD